MGSRIDKNDGWTTAGLYEKKSCDPSAALVPSKNLPSADELGELDVTTLQRGRWQKVKAQIVRLSPGYTGNRKCSGPEELHKFLNGTGEDQAYRSFDYVMGFGRVRGELVHNYIQWVFPTRGSSGHNPHVPKLDQATIDLLRKDKQAQANLRRAMDHMVDFYTNTDAWLKKGDHNQKRITRIIDSLGLLANPNFHEGTDLANEFHGKIMAIAKQKIDKKSDRQKENCFNPDNSEKSPVRTWGNMLKKRSNAGAVKSSGDASVKPAAKLNYDVVIRQLSKQVSA